MHFNLNFRSLFDYFPLCLQNSDSVHIIPQSRQYTITPTTNKAQSYRAAQAQKSSLAQQILLTRTGVTSQNTNIVTCILLISAKKTELEIYVYRFEAELPTFASCNHRDFVQQSGEI